MHNEDIRMLIRRSGFRMYEISDFMGINRTTFSMRLTRELPECEKENIRKAIKEMQSTLV